MKPKYEANGKLGGRGVCDKCGEWHNNVSFHRSRCRGGQYEEIIDIDKYPYKRRKK